MTHVVNCQDCGRSHEFDSRKQMREADRWVVDGVGVRWQTDERHYDGYCWSHKREHAGANDERDESDKSDDTDARVTHPSPSTERRRLREAYMDAIATDHDEGWL
jgi:transcription elongation factor Elf1